jgi:hypothetical protein
MLTFAHSKSNSGIGDLNSKKDWEDGYKRLGDAVDRYNKDHEGDGSKRLEFDRNSTLDNPDRLGALASEAYALRIGDVSRDSGPDAICQSGEAVKVDKSSVNPDATSVHDEVKDAKVMRGDTPITNEKSKQVHIGEQNITGNGTAFDGENINHTVTVNDGSYAPYSTCDALEDHAGELASAKDVESKMTVAFDTPCSDDTKVVYEEWADRMAVKYPNVTIDFVENKKGE